MIPSIVIFTLRYFEVSQNLNIFLKFLIQIQSKLVVEKFQIKQFVRTTIYIFGLRSKMAV